MINSDTKLIALFGNPIKNSFSPYIHNYLFEKYKINNIYTCFNIENIENGIESIKTLCFIGGNITIPHKTDVIKYLDFVDNNSKIIDAVNTIKNENGYLKGYNTDGEGFVKSILDKNHSLKDKNILVIGAGGSSKSICVSLCNHNIKSLKIFNRTLENAQKIKDIIDDKFYIRTCISNKEMAKIQNKEIVKISNKKITEKDLENIDIIINTTSVGMESDECPINKNIKIKDILVCDIVYKPHETEFIKWAKSNNLDVVYGIDMLINQAFLAFNIWTNIMPDDEDFVYLKNLFDEYKI